MWCFMHCTTNLIWKLQPSFSWATAVTRQYSSPSWSTSPIMPNLISPSGVQQYALPWRPKGRGFNSIHGGVYLSWTTSIIGLWMVIIEDIFTLGDVAFLFSLKFMSFMLFSLTNVSNCTSSLFKMFPNLFYLLDLVHIACPVVQRYNSRSITRVFSIAESLDPVRPIWRAYSIVVSVCLIRPLGSPIVVALFRLGCAEQLANIISSFHQTLWPFLFRDSTFKELWRIIECN